LCDNNVPLVICQLKNTMLHASIHKEAHDSQPYTAMLAEQSIDQDLTIVDVYNGGIFPRDEESWPAMDVSIPLRRCKIRRIGSIPGCQAMQKQIDTLSSKSSAWLQSEALLLLSLGTMKCSSHCHNVTLFMLKVTPQGGSCESNGTDKMLNVLPTTLASFVLW